MLEAAIKIKLIDYVLKNCDMDNTVIRTEFLFADSRRRADIALVGTFLHAYEIKSERDNIDKLDSQIADYRNYFEAVHVLCHKKHIEKVREIDKTVGILVIDNDGISRIRTASIRKSIKSKYLIEYFNKEYVIKLCRKYNVKTSDLVGKSIVELQSRLLRLMNNKEIRLEVTKYLLDKYESSYKSFLCERGNFTIEDDLLLLRDVDEYIT